MSDTTATTKKSSRTRFLAILLGIILVAVVAGFAVNSLLHPRVTLPVVNDVIVVNPGTNQTFTAAVPQGATNARLTGTFTASGGSGNDIKVYVLAGPGNLLYNSGQVSTGNIDVSLSSGLTYTLVFDNTFSAVSQKTVNASATLSFNQ